MKFAGFFFILFDFCLIGFSQPIDAFNEIKSKRNIEVLNEALSKHHFAKADSAIALIFEESSFQNNNQLKAALFWEICISGTHFNNTQQIRYYCEKFILFTQKNYKKTDVVYLDYQIRALSVYQNDLKDQKESDRFYKEIVSDLNLYDKDCQYANHLRHFANYTQIRKNYKLTEKLLKIDLECQEREDGKDSGGYAETLIILARMYAEQGKKEKAEKMYVEFIERYKKAFSKDGNDFLPTFYNALDYYLGINQTHTAGLLLEEIEQELIRRKTEHDKTDYFTYVLFRTMYFYKMGEINKAINLFEQTLQESEKMKYQGKFLPEFVKNLAFLYEESGNKIKAQEIKAKYPSFFE